MSGKFRAAFRALLKARLNHSLAVGAVASAMDWGTLVFLVKVMHQRPQVANFPSLMVGSAIQFVGNRHFVFKATHRAASRQALEFGAVEGVAFFMNGGLFYALVTWTSINYALARPLGSFAVFLCFSYPLWRLVFRKNPDQGSI